MVTTEYAAVGVGWGRGGREENSKNDHPARGIQEVVTAEMDTMGGFKKWSLKRWTQWKDLRSGHSRDGHNVGIQEVVNTEMDTMGDSRSGHCRDGHNGGFKKWSLQRWTQWGIQEVVTEEMDTLGGFKKWSLKRWTQWGDSRSGH
ncbi:hypothetical protein Btru_025471 [Bulinus truncatus]|nr:hypothetical protein Btru_025471 [Bulinus truncatus]